MSRYNQKGPDLAKEMERRLAELQAARTTQESKLGIGSVVSAPAPVSAASFADKQVTTKLSTEEWEKQVAELMSGRTAAEPVIPREEIDTSAVFGKKSRESEPVLDLAARMASLAAERGTQDTDFANMVPLESDKKSAPSAYSAAPGKLGGASLK